MPQPPVTVSKSGPGFAQVLKDMRRLQKCDVLVGIPAEKAPRKDGGINSAALLYLHAHGSELMNLPPRPVLEPSILENKGLITPHLGEAARLLMIARPQEARKELQLAGDVASNGAKRYFFEGKLAPNSPATIARKSRPWSKARAREDRRRARKGLEPLEPAEYVDVPLLDTRAMSRAITSVVRYGY